MDEETKPQRGPSMASPHCWPSLSKSPSLLDSHPKEKKANPMFHLSQELLPSQSTSLTFLLTCGNIKLYQDFNCNGFSSVYNKTLSPGTSVEIILINNTYCLPFEGLLFSKQCLMDFFSFLSFKVLHSQYQNKFLTFEPK